MQELKCPDCGYLNPDIRELGYSLPWTCGRCPHIWRLQDLGPIEATMTKSEALAFLAEVGLTAPEYMRLLPVFDADRVAAEEDNKPPNGRAKAAP